MGLDVFHLFIGCSQGYVANIPVASANGPNLPTGTGRPGLPRQARFI
jgi:hypothetical protein